MTMFARQPMAEEPYSGASGNGVAGCCCGGDTIGPCCGCTSMPHDYTVVMAGVTDGTCTGCGAAHNRTWNLIFNDSAPSDCRWFDTLGVVDPCDAIDSLGVEITCDGTYVYVKFAGDRSYASYRKLQVDWSCLGSNELDLYASDAGCANYPATVTATPA